MQIWEKDGIGTDRSTLRKIIGEFRTEGAQGIKSVQCLTNYIRRLDVNTLSLMYEMDKDVTLQILIDCVGAAEAFKAALKFSGWISPEDYKEACKKYDERVGKAQAETDNAQTRLFAAIAREERLKEEIRYKNLEIVTLKAKLYDTYEAMNKPTEKSEVKGDKQKWKPQREITPSDLLE